MVFFKFFKSFFLKFLDDKNSNKDENNKGKYDDEDKDKDKDDDNFEVLNFENSQMIICALSFREKEYWISSFNSAKVIYKNFDFSKRQKIKDKIR